MMNKYSILLVAFLAAGCGTTYRASDMGGADQEVNIGYGTTKRGDLPSSVATLDIQDREIDGYNNMYDYLRGRVPGVSVGPDNSITIRGKSSINLSNEPLIMVDGVEIEDLSIINPKDVKTVDVIKDGSSSIYGVRGANGVILITTKGH